MGGWLFTCTPRERGFTLRAEEALHAAYAQLEQADGYIHGEPPFVTLRMSARSSDACAVHEPLLDLSAWCATKEAMEMRAKGFFETRARYGAFRNAAKVADGYRVTQDGRVTEDVEVTYLHRPLVIQQRTGVLALDLQ